MPWKRAQFRDNRVFAEVDPTGELATSDGRVTIRYNDQAGTKLYRASAARVTLDAQAPVVDLPDGQPADAPSAQAARPSARGSGFGSAGTRTAAQARAAASFAAERLAGLAPGTVVVFTDGSCRGNPGPAGSGAVLLLPDGGRAEASLALGQGTNNIAELSAIGLALELLDEAAVPPGAPVALFTDSNYANGVLALGWKAKANQDLVAGLRQRLRARPGVRLQWVAGHVGVEGNERADELANQGVAGVTARRFTGAQSPPPDPPNP